MIFITVGSHHQGFERLLKKVDALARGKIISDVFVQTGYSDYQPEYCPYAQFVGFNEFQDLIKKSNIVITHAGAGSILNAILHNKPTIAVPRLKKFGEHTNDHQLQLIKILEKEGKIIAVYNIGDLENAIDKAATFKPKILSRGSKIIELIEEYLTETGLIPEKRSFNKHIEGAKLPQMLDCSASIVVYNNSPKLLRAAAESFLRCSLKTHLSVVDNSPQPHLRSALDGLPLDYHFYGSNAGYGKAHNWSIEHSKESRFHLIMNPDIVITPGTMERLIEFMDKNPDVGMVSPRVMNENGTDQFLNKHYPNVLDLFARRFVPRIFLHLLKRRMDHYEMRDVGYAAVCDVEVASGAFMLCRTEALKALAGFDSRYFLYFEDFDLSRKFQQHGYRTVYYPNATVIHFWERAAHKNVRMTLIFIANMYRYFNKWGWKWL